MTDLPVVKTVDISQGEYPPDASVAIQASSDGVNWHDIFTGNVQQMIDNTFDIYLRTSDLGSCRGFAYISKHYNSFCGSCTVLPADNNYTITRRTRPTVYCPGTTNLQLYAGRLNEETKYGVKFVIMRFSMK